MAMKECHDPVLLWASVAHFSIVSLTLAISVVYYAGWGTWIRRRIRSALRTMVLLCCAGAWIPLLFGTGVHTLICAAIVLFNFGLIFWTIKKKLPTEAPERTPRLTWTSLIILSNSLFTAAHHGHISAWALAIPTFLFMVGGVAYVFPYRQWLHATWHFFAIAACLAYYVIVWQYLN